MKYLNRNRIYERVEPSKSAKKIYIFCEGERTEPRYFKFFQGLVSNLDVIPIPCVDGQSAPKKLKEDATRRFLGNAATQLSG
ncbi:MAG: RloB family protein, partial [Planctomycetaceae bacterium]|nr:RloB family protein [Planctomycetaceae bacterium]